MNPGDLTRIIAIQAAYKVEPLSSYVGKPAPAAPTTDWAKPVPPAEQKTSLEVFNDLAFLLQFAEPPHPTEVALRKRFEKIGIIPGKPFDVASLSPEMKSALEAGMADGQKEIDDRRTNLGSSSADLFGTRKFLKNDYVRRALGNAGRHRRLLEGGIAPPDL